MFLKPIKAKDDGVGDGDDAQGDHLRLSLDTEGSDYVMCDVARSDGTVIDRGDRDRLVLQMAGKSVTIHKGERNARCRSAGINESICMNGFFIGKERVTETKK